MRALRKPDHAHPTGRPLQCAPTTQITQSEQSKANGTDERQDGVHGKQHQASSHPRNPTARAKPTSGPAEPADPADGLLNINTAGSDELQTLKGVGPVTAQRIIDYRNQIGRFDNVDQLLEVKGIGEKTLAKFRDQVCAR
ncbi:MAG: ComEA family DNA-binding protein [Bifidobacterium sp.]